MADNTELATGSGGDVIRTDDNAGVKTPVSKIELGIDGAFDGFVAATNPMPVGGNTVKDGTGTAYSLLVDADGHLQVDTVATALPTGASTAANQATANAALAAIQVAAELLDDAVYTDGTGTPSKALAVAGTDGTNPQILSVNASGHVNIADGGNVITVDGTVTANAGTNLNTSALALETGGNLAAAATSLAVIDDWDESDRCAVNLIASQVGITAGAGAVATNTPRVTLASDDPAVALLGTIDSGTGSIVTAVQLLDDCVYADDADWTDSTSKHLLVGGVYQSVQQTITDGDVGPLQVDSNGNVKVNVVAGSATNTEYTEDTAASGGEDGPLVLGVRRDADTSPVSADGDFHTLVFNSTGALKVEVFDGGDSHTVDNAGTFAVQVDAALPAGTNAIGKLAANDGVDVGDVTLNNGFASVTGGGVEASALRVTLANDSTGVVSVDDNGGSLTVDGSVTAAQSGTWTVQPGNTANTTPWLVTDLPTTSGGLSLHKTISAASTNGTSVKGSAGHVYGIQAFNTNAAARYLKLYNKASAPTVGTDTPVKVLTIPGNTAGAGLIVESDKGLAFGTGIAFALTTGVADSDTGAVAANELVVNIDYK